ncbi:MAG: hypothetical protein ACREAU_01720 [Nitrosopumilaceae archaeon]
MNFNLPVEVKGHLNIQDDLGNIFVDKENAVHPQNMARVIARALANESNFYIHRMAFGNGGTIIGVTFDITYMTVNDGQPPDVRTWDSRLYRETYAEIVDEGNPTLNLLLGTDPGSADSNTGTRPGGGSVPSGDPASVPHVSGPGVRSNELGLTSEVVVTCVLNPDEPSGQFATDALGPIEDPDGSFTFDEIALYTTGAPAIATNGSQDIDVGNRTALDDTGLTANTPYNFNIAVNGGGVVNINFITPAAGGSGPGNEILYGDLVKAILTGDVVWNPVWAGFNPLPGVGTTVNITNDGSFDPFVPLANTFGFLRFISGTTGTASSIALTAGTPGPQDMIAALNPPIGGIIKPQVNGRAAGVQNNPVTPSTEAERLLAMVVFSPVLKAKNRTLTITYTLTVSVARSTT